ncbi:hypothetical protein QBC36DRAFT_304776 [Triangularia setosa]|uniref:Uncharacterized protein n=1 Tax=Triangularia setosa TaxID=2587417 RepID=A0AAN7A2V9_9PEZI|nr:hypothetical protein QBC36DRAFT_304776 [Podospora setosa]
MTQNIIIVDTTEQLSALLSELANLPRNPPSLYVDLRGEDLSQRGTIAILQMHVHPTNHTYLMDLNMLQRKNFSRSPLLRSSIAKEEIQKVRFSQKEEFGRLERKQMSPGPSGGGVGA